MSPHFPKQTIDTLARRARYQCSNPDCGVQTVGPNTAIDRATIIGEAAHIHGANPGSARYSHPMSDNIRSAITNGIWLCRNCHVKIDRDEEKYSPELLLVWRKKHEEQVLAELGTRGDKIKYDLELENLYFLNGFPKILQRIVLDKPRGWEFRFLAELMRHLNKPELKQLRDLRLGHYFRQQPRVKQEDFMGWIAERTHAMGGIIAPLSYQFDKLTSSVGKPGEPSNLEEMYDACILINGTLKETIKHEELLRFTSVPDEGEELRNLLTDAISSNIEKIEELPNFLDNTFSLVDTEHGGTKDNPRIETWVVPFDLPPHFDQNYTEALKTYLQKIGL